MSYALIYLRYSRIHRRRDMSQQSTAMPDSRYFLKLLLRSIRYDPISRVYYLIAKRVNEVHQQEEA